MQYETLELINSTSRTINYPISRDTKGWSGGFSRIIFHRQWVSWVGPERKKRGRETPWCLRLSRDVTPHDDVTPGIV